MQEATTMGSGATTEAVGAVVAGPRRPRAALALILSVAFMVVLDFSIVNVALAAIERELHAGATAVQWVITAYAITFGGLLVLGGRMGDLWGRRRLLVVGLVIFSLASLAGGLAGDLTMLVVARALQGVGAAIVAPAALSLITTSVPEGRRGPVRSATTGRLPRSASSPASCWVASSCSSWTGEPFSG
jgi:MFS family permease